LDIIKEFVKCLMSERDSIREQERQIKLKIKGVKEEIKALKQQLVRPAKDVVRRIMGIR
jgi:peptidoglycan hydrolase CwlO-like protein